MSLFHLDVDVRLARKCSGSGILCRAVRGGSWTVLGPFATWAALAILPHAIFKRAWLDAFGGEAHQVPGPDAPDVDVGQESFSQQLGRRIRRVSERYLASNERQAMTVTLAMATKPVDELVLEMLRRDHHGRILADVTHVPRNRKLRPEELQDLEQAEDSPEQANVNPVRQCLQELASCLHDSSVPDIVSKFFPLEAGSQSPHMRMFRACVLELAAATWYRVDVYIQRYPFKLAHLVPPRIVQQRRGQQQQNCSWRRHVAWTALSL